MAIDYNILFGNTDTADANTWGGQVVTMEGNSAAAYGAGGGLLTVTGSVSPVSITVTGGTMVIDGGFVSTPLVTLNNSIFDMSGAGGASGTDFDFNNGVSGIYMPTSLGSNTANGMSFTNMNDGDFIKLNGTVSNLSYSQADHTLTFDLGGTTYNVDVTLSPDDPTANFNIVDGGDEIVDGGLACYARGTRIRTPHGEIAVEMLRAGDKVLTTSGEPRPIVWLGHRTWRRGRAPRWLWPVRIAADAFGPGKPSRDLTVSPEHGICVTMVEETFIPAGKLVNGATIAHVETDEIEYWHIELESHDVLIAEGLPAESYLECGNRDWFSGKSIEPDPERAGEYHARAVRPYLGAGPEMDAACARLRARAKALGWCETNDMDLHLIIDGHRAEASVDGDRACFLIPNSARAVVLATETFYPADHGKDDHRELGISLRGFRLRDGFGMDCTITPDHPALADAFHTEEAGSSSRWTRANLALPSELWSGSRGPVLLTLTFDPAASRRWIAPVTETEETNVVPLRAAG